MNPNYTLHIKVIIAAHKSSRDGCVRLKRYIDFVPYEGMKIKFINDDGDELEITLVNMHYDYNNREFVEHQEDDTLLDELRDPDRPECTITKERMQEYMAQYIAQGFEAYAP